MSIETRPVRIFIAYSSKDLLFKDEIRKRLRPLQRAKKVDIWDNYDMEAGADWDADIREKLEQSDLILLLLSPDALASDYFFEVEAPIALRRHQAGEATAVGVLLRPCDLKYTPFGDLTRYELLPKKGYPVTDPKWADHDEAYLSIFRGIDFLVNKIEALRNGWDVKIENGDLDLNLQRDSIFESDEHAKFVGRTVARELTSGLLKAIGRSSIDPEN